MTIDDQLSPVEDGTALRQAYSCFPSGVVAVCNRSEFGLIGMAASSFATVSMDPPLVSLCVQNSSSTWPKLRTREAIGVSVFASDQTDACKQLAGPSESRFESLAIDETSDGAVFVGSAAAQLHCSLYNEVQVGDHILVVLRIESLRADPDVEPLVFHASTFRALESRARKG